jgi:Asp-tRNA(Asn)/Glu-tRNA(Gln) amidotransferase B subunit
LNKLLANLCINHVFPECEKTGRKIGEGCTPEHLAFIAHLIKAGKASKQDARRAIRKLISGN